MKLMEQATTFSKSQIWPHHDNDFSNRIARTSMKRLMFSWWKSQKWWLLIIAIAKDQSLRV